jgi:hypothetical protein
MCLNIVGQSDNNSLYIQICITRLIIFIYLFIYLFKKHNRLQTVNIVALLGVNLK